MLVERRCNRERKKVTERGQSRQYCGDMEP
jgi:hypothetical protein